MVCVNSRRRSASVDLPWSMCAIIEKFLMYLRYSLSNYLTSMYLKSKYLCWVDVPLYWSR